MQGLRCRDPERDAKMELMEVWEGIFGNNYVVVVEVVATAHRYIGRGIAVSSTHSRVSSLDKVGLTGSLETGS
jgi:hypothetical protein